MPTTLTYNAYPFSPVPLIRMSRTANKTPAGEILGFNWQLTLTGDLVEASTGGIISIDALQDALVLALAPQGKLLELKCDDTVLLSAYPRINSVSFDQGVWVNRSTYTIEMEFDTLSGVEANYVSDYSEDWSFDFIDEKTGYSWTLPNTTVDTLPYQIRITHNISATGKSIYGSTGLIKSAFEQAKEYVTLRLGLDPQFIENEGVVNLLAADFTAYNHFRTVNANESGGSYAVNESWILLTGDNHAVEDFTISLRTGAETPVRTVSIEGNIQGLETRTYGAAPGNFTISEYKYDAAVDHWAIIKPLIIHRCNLILDTVSTIRDLNIVPISTSEGHNPYAGTISYAYEFNDRPSNCLAGAISENITVNDNNPADIFASLFVLGRANGVLLQDLGTKTGGTRSVQIEAVYEPPSGCPTTIAGVEGWLQYQVKPPGQTDADDIIAAFEDQLESVYAQVFRSEDSQSWNPKNGNFTRSVTWSYAQC